MFINKFKRIKLREPTLRADPPETPPLNNGIYIVFDINH
jgi:hypothetical protein